MTGRTQLGGTDDSSTSRGAPRASTRRRVLKAGAVATAVGAAAAVVNAPRAEAANGAALVVGAINTGTATTALTGSTADPLVRVANTGAGVGGTSQSARNHGFTGVTADSAKFGLAGANTATGQGPGAAVSADGGQNNGVYAVTRGNTASAVSARQAHATDAHPLASAIQADGNMNDGIFAFTNNRGAAGVLAFSAVGPDGAAVQGVGFNGGIALLGFANDDASLGLSVQGRSQFTGTAVFAGDVIVGGTLYAPTVVNSLPPGFVRLTPNARSVAKRAERVAARLRVIRPQG